MGFSRQEYWSGLPFPSEGDLPDQGSNAGLLHCRDILYLLRHQEGLFADRKEVLFRATASMDLDNIVLRDRRQPRRITWFMISFK